MTSRHRSLGVLGLLLGLAGCIFVPRSSRVFDEDCQTHAQQMTLEYEVAQGLLQCSGQGCGAMLVAAGVVSAASVVVSGSIVVVGNVVYWFEKQGRCLR
jgi:hypothetical protein